MDNVYYVERVKESLQRLGLMGEIADTEHFIHIKANGREFEISHNFMRLVNRKGLDNRIRYGAGLEAESHDENV